MPVPAHLQGAPAFTDSGIPFIWLIDGYKEKRAADANYIVLHAVVGWDDSEDWIKEVTGYTTWDSGSQILNRHLPLQCPLAETLWLDDLEAVRTGIEKGTTLLADPFNNNAPHQDWVRYQCTFVRPKWWVRTDDALLQDFDSQEQHRYVRRNIRFAPREQRVGGHFFEVDENPGGAADWQPTEAVVFLPNTQLEFLLTWKQVPFDAVPFTAYETQLLSVNDADFTMPGNALTAEESRTYPAGDLLFRGVSFPDDWYEGADANFYADPQIVLAYQPGGWNKQLLRTFDAGPPPARRYGSVRQRGVAPDTPPYASSDFGKLFTPSDL